MVSKQVLGAALLELVLFNDLQCLVLWVVVVSWSETSWGSEIHWKGYRYCVILFPFFSTHFLFVCLLFALSEKPIFTFQYVIFSLLGKNIYKNIETYVYAHMCRRERKWERPRACYFSNTRSLISRYRGI